MRSLLLGAVVAIVACGGSSRPNGSPDAGHAVDAALTNQDATPMVCYEPSESGMVMPGASSIEDCAIWNNLAEMTGTVTVARTGANISMSFGSGALVYNGTVTGTAVLMTEYALHDFEDGCEWRATETLTGMLDPSSCQLSLLYHYAETVEIDNGDCATPCEADGSFALDIVPVLE
jgi:hypothetical protein